MKQVLIETQTFQPFKSQIVEGKTSSKGNPLVEGILATVEIENGNGRFYPKDIWEREINNYQTLIDENRSTGELDHPDDQIINLKNVSHIIRKTWWDNKNIMGLIEILPTPSGNILKTLIENNVLVGVSSRGLGTLQQVGERMEVQDDFELQCWDFVSTPSNPYSWMNLREGLNESIKIPVNPYLSLNTTISEILCAKAGKCSL
jgi:hypothetical protein